MTAQELKNSILQMAVQGKLVPQDPNDEPASVLLERIRAEKEKQIKEGKIKREKNPSVIFRGADNTPYEKVGNAEPVSIADEVPFEIPDSWEWARIKDVILYDVGGGTPDKSNSDYWGGNIPWMSVKDFSGAKNGVIEDTVDHITQLGVENSATNIIDTDAIILCTRMGLGRTARFAQPTAINQDLRAIWLSHNINESYFLFFYSTLNITGSGVTVKGIKREELFSMLIPVPPIEEQDRIVAQMNRTIPFIQEYGIRYGKLEALQKSFPDQLRKSILQLAVQGKLVPQDPNDEPASVLLERIRAEKERLIAEGKIKRDKHESIIYRRDNSHYELRDGVERCIDEEIPFDIPDSWAWCRLVNIVSILGDGIHGTPNYSSVGAYYFINGNNLENGKIIIKDDTKRVTKEEAQKHFRNLTNRSILTSINGTIGNIAFYNDEPVILGKSACYFNLMGSIYKEYIKALLETDYYVKYALKAATGTTIKNVPLKGMRDFLVPLPPVNEQYRIVRMLTHLEPFCNSL